MPAGGDPGSKITGAMGTPPPPGAPIERTDAANTQAALDARAQLAKQFEQAPDPVYAPPPLSREQMIALIGEDAVKRQEVAAASSPAAAAVPPPAAASVPTQPPEPEPGAHVVAAPPSGSRPVQAEMPAGSPPDKYQPAASDTDTPSRGQPRAIADPGKQITGGFGDGSEAQYFPLTGQELKELVGSLLDRLSTRLQDDLRFSIAATYPRANVRLDLRIECWGTPAIDIPVVLAPRAAGQPGSTPLDVASQYGYDVVFIIREDSIEMTDDGTSVTPPNAVRTMLELPIPRKQRIKSGAGHTFVDVR